MYDLVLNLMQSLYYEFFWLIKQFLCNLFIANASTIVHFADNLICCGCQIIVAATPAAVVQVLDIYLLAFSLVELVKCPPGLVAPRTTLTCSRTGKKESCSLTCASKAYYLAGMYITPSQGTNTKQQTGDI